MLSLSLHFYEMVLLYTVIKLVCLLVTIAYYTLAERKVMAAVQRRHGPDVVGFWGLLQPLADGLKLFAKELVVPTHSNARLFIAAPMAVLTLAFLAWAVVPFFSFDYSEITAFFDRMTSVMLYISDEEYNARYKACCDECDEILKNAPFGEKTRLVDECWAAFDEANRDRPDLVAKGAQWVSENQKFLINEGVKLLVVCIVILLFV